MADAPGSQPDEASAEGAQIIPIGTRGKPGRGTNTANPSRASRNLATASVSRPTRAEAKTPASPPIPTQGLWEAAAEAAAEAASEVLGDDGERHLAEFLAFVRRRLTGDYQIDTFGLDSELTTRFMAAFVRPLAEKWFRIEVRGVENIPPEGAALLVSNHSGTLPLDALVTMSIVLDHSGRHLRSLGADLIFRLPFIGELARKGGITLASAEDAERLLAEGEIVGVWPEGFKGIGKPFSERYKLQRFGRGGFVATAIRAQAPIVPVSVVGAEEIYPLIGNIPSLARLLGVPYIPITPFFPLLGPLGLIPLPSKWIVEFGEPISTEQFDPADADDPMVTFDVADQVRDTIQRTLRRLLKQRGGIFG